MNKYTEIRVYTIGSSSQILIDSLLDQNRLMTRLNLPISWSRQTSKLGDGAKMANL